MILRQSATVDVLRPCRFDSQIKLEFHGVSVTSDAGLVAYRELDEAMGLTAMADELFDDQEEHEGIDEPVGDVDRPRRRQDQMASRRIVPLRRPRRGRSDSWRPQ